MNPPTLAEIRSGLRDGTASVRSLIAHTLDAAACFASTAWISRFDDAELLHAAERCDARLREHGPALLAELPLFGVPFAV